LFFLLPAQKEKLHHKTTHLQTTASQPCISKFAKELFYPSAPSVLMENRYFNFELCFSGKRF